MNSVRNVSTDCLGVIEPRRTGSSILKNAWMHAPWPEVFPRVFKSTGINNPARELGDDRGPEPPAIRCSLLPLFRYAASKQCVEINLETRLSMQIPLIRRPSIVGSRS